MPDEPPKTPLAQQYGAGLFENTPSKRCPIAVGDIVVGRDKTKAFRVSVVPAMVDAIRLEGLDGSYAARDLERLGPAQLAVGTRVVRGPHWRWRDQDGGAGQVGQVRMIHDDGWVGVVWTNGNNAIYRWGHYYDKAKQYDLRVVEEPSAPPSKMRDLLREDPVAHELELQRRREATRVERPIKERTDAEAMGLRLRNIELGVSQPRVSADYKALLSASWSAELRRQLAVKKEAERNRVTCQSAWDDEDLL